MYLRQYCKPLNGAMNWSGPRASLSPPPKKYDSKATDNTPETYHMHLLDPTPLRNTNPTLDHAIHLLDPRTVAAKVVQ